MGTLKLTDFLELPLIDMPAKSLILSCKSSWSAPETSRAQYHTGVDWSGTDINRVLFIRELSRPLSLGL